MRTRRLVVATVVGLPLVAVAVLGVEVELARRAENLDEVELGYPDAGSTHAVWIGDSTAYGVGVTRGSDALPSLVAAARDERVTNLAVSGATLSEVVEEQMPQVAAEQPDIVYVSVGANDVTHLTRSGSFRRDYVRLLRGLPPGVPVVVLGVPDMGAPPRLAQPLRALAGLRGRQLDGLARNAAATRSDATYVDIAGQTGPSFRRDPDRFFADDGYHPDADGYRQWADAVLAAVG